MYCILLLRFVAATEKPGSTGLLRLIAAYCDDTVSPDRPAWVSASTGAAAHQKKSTGSVLQLVAAQCGLLQLIAAYCGLLRCGHKEARFEASSMHCVDVRKGARAAEKGR